MSSVSLRVRSLFIFGWILTVSSSFSHSSVLRWQASETRSSTARIAASTTRSTSVAVAAVVTQALDSQLELTLCKPSKTSSVVLEVSDKEGFSDDDITMRSMQLRQLGVSALCTRSARVATLLVEEQESARGSFPGPCPVLFMIPGSEWEDSDSSSSLPTPSAVIATNDFDAGGDTAVISLLRSVDDAAGCNQNDEGAYAVDAESDDVLEILDKLPEDCVVLAMVSSMQDQNAELDCKTLPKVSGVLLKDAIVGDSEDLDYAQFIIDGITKKKSTTFNMSGLTGSTNGHFGGVASLQPATWLRCSRNGQIN